MGIIRSLFALISVFSNKYEYKFYDKLNFLDPVLGIELTTFRFKSHPLTFRPVHLTLTHESCEHVPIVMYEIIVAMILSNIIFRKTNYDSSALSLLFTVSKRRKSTKKRPRMFHFLKTILREEIYWSS